MLKPAGNMQSDPQPFSQKNKNRTGGNRFFDTQRGEGMSKTKCMPLLGSILFFMITVGLTGCAPTIPDSIKDDLSQTEISDEPLPAEEYTGPKLRIGVVNFLNKTPSEIPEIGEAAADILEKILQKTNRFIIISQQDISSIINQQTLGTSGVIKPATAAKMGKILGLNAVVTGAISDYSESEEESNYLFYKKRKLITHITIDYRIVDTTTGIQLMADSSQGVYSEETGGMLTESTTDTGLKNGALGDALTKAMVNILKQLKAKEWIGRIARVAGKKVYINAGQKTGLQVGNILIVQDLGEDIIDPQTGVSLGKSPGDIKGELIITAFSGNDESVATIRSGGGFEYNDLVRLKK
jgi:curli biogenesis system outer membrane secretion channel CsgG